MSEASSVYVAEYILIANFSSSYIDVSTPFFDMLIGSDSLLSCSVVSLSLAHVITGLLATNEAIAHTINNCFTTLFFIPQFLHHLL